VSQFRLKSEETWEVECKEGASSTDLSLNLDELVEVVRCVPLHQVLGIEEMLLLVRSTKYYILKWIIILILEHVRVQDRESRFFFTVPVNRDRDREPRF